MRINIVFDGPPAECDEERSGRFIDIEDTEGRSINVGRWITREDGWALQVEIVGEREPEAG